MKHERSCILTYHSLDSSGSVISIRPEVFRDQLEYLAETGTPVVPLHAVRDTPGAVAITFDDGYRNFYEHAVPALRKHGFPATVFVVSEYCGRRNDWPTQPRNTGLPIMDLMDWSQIAELSHNGIDIGCHTATHPHLDQLSAREIEMELSVSCAAIEDRTGKPVLTFAYPYGEFNPAVREAVRRRFPWACSTRLAYLSTDSDPADLPRIEIYYLQKSFWFKQLLSTSGNAYLAARGMLRGLRQTFK